MAHRFIAFADVEIRFEIFLRRTQVTEKPVNVAIHLRGNAVNLNAVTGRKEDDLLEIAADLQPATCAAQRRGRHRDAFTQFHRRGFVTEACDKHFHAFCSEEFRQLRSPRLRADWRLLCILCATDKSSRGSVSERAELTISTGKAVSARKAIKRRMAGRLSFLIPPAMWGLLFTALLLERARMRHEAFDFLVRRAFDWLHQDLVFLVLLAFFDRLESLFVGELGLDFRVGEIFHADFLAHLGFTFAVSAVALDAILLEQFLHVTRASARERQRKCGDQDWSDVLHIYLCVFVSLHFRVLFLSPKAS